MHRMMAPMTLFQGSKSFNNRSSALGQSATLSAKEKKYIANVERALQSFESVDEWADYIAFLVKLQKALLTNPDKNNTNWIPFDYQVSITLSKCISPSLPSGVHKKTIELYNTIFDILKSENVGKSITLWLPGILPLMLYASISIKQELLDFYNLYICSIDPIYLRSCFKSILLSLLPALDDTTSEFFDSTIELIENLKSQLKDTHHFWQCMLLTIITSTDKRVGAMEYMTRKLPDFNIKSSPEMTKETILSSLSPDAVACLTPESGLLIKALCSAMRDDNLFVQRGFFDILLAKLPLNSAIFDVLITANDTQDLLISVTSTVLRKDMSLNRRLWNWFLGPESPHDNDQSNTRLIYFKTHAYQYLLDSLLKLANTENEDLTVKFVQLCNISVSIMDKWEIGQLILPNLFTPILKTSMFIHENKNDDFDKVIKAANKLFDGVETHMIWANILKLLKSNDIDMILFILQYYNVEDEEMIANHVPLILLSALSLFQPDYKHCTLIQTLLGLLSPKSLLPLDMCDSQLLAMEYYTDELNVSISNKIDEFYAFDGSTDNSSNNTKPFQNTQFPALYLGLISNIVLHSFENEDGEIFMKTSECIETLMQTIPTSSTKSWDFNPIRSKIEANSGRHADIRLSFGMVTLFQYIVENVNKLHTLRLLKIIIKPLWECLCNTNGKFQVEIVGKFWDLEITVGPEYIEAALCELLLEMEFEQRLEQFNTLWVHLSNDNNESRTVLHRPLYLILEEMNKDLYSSSIKKWIKSSHSSGDLTKIFRILCSELFNQEFIGNEYDSNNHDIDLGQIAYDLEIIYNLLKVDDEVLNAFKLELCVIDNDKQIQFINERKWEASTYKSYMINVLIRFTEINVLHTNEKTNESYLKAMRLSLKLIEILLDGSEPNFTEVFASLASNCEDNCSRSDTSISTKTLTNSFYLETITKLIKLSIKNGNTSTIFNVEAGKNNNSVNLLDFITIGLKSCENPVSYSDWISLVLTTGEYYPDVTYQICYGLIECMCSKIETVLLLSSTQDSSNMNESICEVISGMEFFLLQCHKHLGYMLSDTFGFNNLSNSNQTKESGFFGSVIQGVFQVETENEKNEGIKMKRYLIETLRRSVSTIYEVWSVLESNRQQGSEIEEISNTKTFSYQNRKLRFRCKRFIEQVYLMNSLESTLAIVECHQLSTNENKFKVFNILDDCSQKVVMSYILDGIMSNVNYSSIDETRRSSLTSKLNESDLSDFLVEYTSKMKDNESVEHIWPEIQAFLKDAVSNPSYYKFIYPHLLRFLCALKNKINSTSFGKLKRVTKELNETFIKILNSILTIKINRSHNALSTNAMKTKEIVSEESTLNNVTSTEKIIFRKDVCESFKEVIPFMRDTIGDDDKTNVCFNTLINGLSSFLIKGGSIAFDTLPSYVIDLLITMSETPSCISLKTWRSLCQDILNDSGFFKIGSLNLDKWNTLMKNWILKDDSKLIDMVNNKLVFSSTNNTSSTLLFNWNDEVDILNSNIPIIKRINYLILVSEKDTFITIIGSLVKKIDDYIKAFRQMTKYCLLESWILVLLRTIVFKFSESHLTDLWTIINKSMYYLLNETYQRANETLEEDDKDASIEDEVFNRVFLEQCKLLDVLVLLGNEDFQLSQWIFISDSMDGIFKSSPDESDVGIVEKLSKCQKSIKSLSAISSGPESEGNKKVPMLKNVNYINSFTDLKRFFSMLKINKYENDYEIKEVDYECIVEDIFVDLFDI